MAPEKGRDLNLDRYIDRDSVVHGADARVKFIGTIAFILALSLLPMGSFVALGVAWVAVMAVSVLAKIGPLKVIRGSFIALPFVLASVPLIFTREGEEIFTIDLWLFSLTATWEGLFAVLTIMLKSWVSVQAATLLVFTTRFHDLMHALQQLHLPPLMVAVTSLMYRYLAVLTNEATTMMRARASRSASLEGARRPSWIWQAKVVGNLVGSLFLRSYERAERIYVSMQSRGYDGRIVHHNERALRATDTVSLAAVGMALILFEVAAFAWFPRP